MRKQEFYISNAIALATALDLPVVATHPIQFIETEDFKAHEARVCIAEGYVLADTRRPKIFTEEQYFKTQSDMVTLFADVPEALRNSVEIAKRCNLTLSLGKISCHSFLLQTGKAWMNIWRSKPKKLASPIGSALSRSSKACRKNP